MHADRTDPPSMTLAELIGGPLDGDRLAIGPHTAILEFRCDDGGHHVYFRAPSCPGERPTFRYGGREPGPR